MKFRNWQLLLFYFVLPTVVFTQVILGFYAEDIFLVVFSVLTLGICMFLSGRIYELRKQGRELQNKKEEIERKVEESLATFHEQLEEQNNHFKSLTRQRARHPLERDDEKPPLQ